MGLDKVDAVQSTALEHHAKDAVLNSKNVWAEVNAVRITVDGFALPEANKIECWQSPSSYFDPRLWNAARGIIANPRTSLNDATALTTDLSNYLNSLPASGLTDNDLEAADCITAPEPHDAYFRIARSEQTTQIAYVRGIIAALKIFFEEAATPEDLVEYGIIGTGLLDMWSGATIGVPPHNFTTRERLGSGTPVTGDAAVRRWIRGHQIFAVLSQGLIWTMHKLEAAHAAGDDKEINQELTRMARLYDASAAAFSFTAEFDRDIYVNKIRPSMCEPHTPPGFSGQLSTDHLILVKMIGAKRGLVEAVSQTSPTAYADMKAALSGVYANHIKVCAHFDGANLRSLKTAQTERDSPAIDMLQRFKTARTNMIP